MKLLAMLEILIALVIAWRALVVCNHMTGATHSGVRAGWVLAGGGAAWWALATLAGGPVRTPLTALAIALVLLALFERHGKGGRHDHA